MELGNFVNLALCCALCNLCSDNNICVQITFLSTTMRTRVLGVYVHSPLHPLLADVASRAALVCQTLPPPSLMKAVNKLSIQGCTQWNGGVTTWKVFLNCRKSSVNANNISWHHLFNSLFPKDLWCLHTFRKPLMLSCFTHSLPSDMPSTARAAQITPSLTLCPWRFQLHQSACFLLC